MPSPHTFDAYMICCPLCNRMVKLNLAWLGLFPMRCGLGPANFVCTKCGTVYESGLQEWSRMGVRQKVNFIFHTLAYAIIGGFFSAALILVLEAAVTTPDTPFIETLAVSKLLIIWGCIAGVVLLIQALRVNLSLERTLVETSPYTARYSDLQINLQAWVLKILMVSFTCIYLGLKYFG